MCIWSGGGDGIRLLGLSLASSSATEFGLDLAIAVVTDSGGLSLAALSW